MRMSYNVPVWGPGTERLDALVTLGWLTPVADLPPGCTGQGYRVAGQLPLGLADLWTLSLGGVLITADVYRLPSSALQALLRDSEAQLYDTATLEAQLEAGPVRGWWPQVLAVARSGPASGQTMQGSALVQAATWLPDQTRLTRGSRGWTVTLAFDVVTALPAGQHDQVFGVDVGVSPLATVRAPGLDLTVPGVWVPNTNPSDPPHEIGFAMRQISRTVVYGVARRRWETLFASVLPQASVVGVERLDGQILRARFRQLCTDVAIQDALLAWWPQVAREAGVRLIRVDPALTSVTCSRCLEYGERQQARLTCPKHGVLNAHGDAAELIRILAIAQVLQERQAQAAARRRA